MEFTQDQTPNGIVIVLRGSFTFKDHHGFRAVLDALTAAGGGCWTWPRWISWIPRRLACC